MSKLRLLVRAEAMRVIIYGCAGKYEKGEREILFLLFVSSLCVTCAELFHDSSYT